MIQIDLQDSTTVIPSTVTDVAMFKEAVPTPRVVADSSKFLVYSLKNASTLRVLARANNAQGMFKLHQNDVQAAKFVNYKSNVIATAAKDEFLVWFITAENMTVETKVYLSIKDNVSIRSFTWFIDSMTGTPELLILYGTTVAQLQSSKLIAGFGSVETEVNLKDYALPFDRQVTQDAAFTAVGAGGLFAFSTDAASVAVCTARHGNAPAFRPCDGEPLIGLEILQDKPAVLAAMSASCAMLWSIDAEPRKLYKITIGAPIALALATQNTLALYNLSKEVFLVDVANKAVQQHTRHSLAHQVPSVARSVTLNATESGFATMVDFGSRLSIQTMKRPAASAPAAPQSAPFVDPAIVSTNVMPSARPGAPSVIPPPAYVPQATAVQTRVPLTNSMLPQAPQDGQIAQAMDQCQQELAQLKVQLDSAVQNTNQILTLVPQMVKRDHSSLLTLSLEAQITELQNAVKQGEIGSGPGSAGPVGFESQLLATLMDDVANRLVEGLVPGIRDALLGDLEPSLRTAVMGHLKKTQKDVFKNRVDAVLKNVVTEFVAELERKQRAYEKQFENYGKEVRRVTETGMLKLVQQVSILEEQIAAIQASNVLEEVKELRAEVQALRAAAALGAPTEVVIAPATILATARAMIEGGEPERGLEYVARMNVTDATIELLEELGRNDDLRDSVLQVQNDTLWEKILTQLAGASNSVQLATALGWIKDVVTDHDKPAKNPVVRNALTSFIATWKLSEVNAALQKELRVVEKLVR